MTAARTPQGTEWRTTAPDPAASRWWWVDRRGSHNGRFVVVEAHVGDDGPGLYLGWLLLTATWPAGWRCAPVLDVAEVRRAALEEALAIAKLEASVTPELADDARVAAEYIADRIRALIPAARPEAAPSPARPDGYGPSPLAALYPAWVAAGRPAAPETSPPPPQRAEGDVWYRMDADGRAYPPPGLDPKVDAELARRVADVPGCARCEHCSGYNAGPDEATTAALWRVTDVARDLIEIGHDVTVASGREVERCGRCCCEVRVDGTCGYRCHYGALRYIIRARPEWAERLPEMRRMALLQPTLAPAEAARLLTRVEEQAALSDLDALKAKP